MKTLFKNNFFVILTIATMLFAASSAQAEVITPPCFVSVSDDLTSTSQAGYGNSLRMQLLNAQQPSNPNCAIDEQFYDKPDNANGIVPANADGNFPKNWIWFNTYDYKPEDGTKVQKIALKQKLTINLGADTILGNPSTYAAQNITDTENSVVDYTNQTRIKTSSGGNVFSNQAIQNLSGSNDLFVNDFGHVVLDFRTYLEDRSASNPRSIEDINFNDYIECADGTKDLYLWNVILLFPENALSRDMDPQSDTALTALPLISTSERNDSYKIKKVLFEQVSCLKDMGAVYTCAGNLRKNRRGADEYIYNPSTQAEGSTIAQMNNDWCVVDMSPNRTWEIDPIIPGDTGTVGEYFPDNDGDGYGDAGATPVDTAQDGYVDNNDDCDDTNGAVNPDAGEICDGIDNNCDGFVDMTPEGQSVCLDEYYPDLDGDGYGDAGGTPVNIPQDGYVDNNDDCDDTNAGINPGAAEICGNGIDEDCSGADLECTETGPFYEDLDGDGYGDPASETNTPAEGLVTVGGDCNDDPSDPMAPEINPGATEVCDGIDNNCDGLVDQIFDTNGGVATIEVCEAETNCTDGLDNDGNGLQDCEEPACDCTDADGDGFTVVDGDCNDNNPEVYPGAPEQCNFDGIDFDCDGVVNDDLICITTNVNPNTSTNVGEGFIVQNGGAVAGCSLNTTMGSSNSHQSLIILAALSFAFLPLLRLRRRYN